MKNKYDLESIEWGEFQIGEIFKNTYRGKRQTEASRIKGDIAYYSASSINNGLTDFISNPAFVDENKVIVTTFCDSYYIENEFSASDEITILGHSKLNKYNGLYIAYLISSNKSKYAFGRKAFSDRVVKQKILLPKDSSGNPDWDFMENYMRDKEKQQLETALNYYKNKLGEEEAGNVSLEKCEWKEYEIEEIFNIYTGGDLIISRVKPGNIPVITHGTENNGIGTYSKNIEKKKIFDSNTTLSLADRGNFWTFIQSKSFYIGTRVKALELKDNKKGKYILKFLSNSINKQSTIFSYGRNGCHRLPKLKIILPVTKSGNPDWDFMEKFMQYQEQKLVKQYITHIENKI